MYFLPQVKPLVEKNKVKKKKAKGKEGGLGFKKLQEEHQKLADVQHTPLLYDVRLSLSLLCKMS